MTRDYYNRRVGKDGEPPSLTLAETAELIAEAYAVIDGHGHLQRAFGFDCVDAGEVPGTEGYGIRMSFFLKTTIRINGALKDAIKSADEVFLFTFIEFVHDHVAKPAANTGWYHQYSSCGWHYSSDGDFDEVAARAEWRSRVNTTLKFYDSGYQLSEAGEIEHLAPNGMVPLLQAQPPAKTKQVDRDKIANAVRTFQLGRSTRPERKQAVRDLVDVLEFHRQEVKIQLLSKDESDLFNMANNFALRHHNDLQRDDYDDSFLTWLFFLYLSTVHLILACVAGEPAFLEKRPEGPPSARTPDEFDDIPF